MDSARRMYLYGYRWGGQSGRTPYLARAAASWGRVSWFLVPTLSFYESMGTPVNLFFCF
jgi:hypothetical protein